jgi:hypothetical protein
VVLAGETFQFAAVVFGKQVWPPPVKIRGALHSTPGPQRMAAQAELERCDCHSL